MSQPALDTVHAGDALAVLRTWPDACVDAIVTDPPYGLRFMGKRWDYDVPGIELWSECLRVLKDGGRMLAFSGARTQHRMVCNIEDAGFAIEDCVMWLYGQGYPKHTSKLKPAYEPICVARKGKVTELNIDAGRIGDSKDVPASVSKKRPANCYGKFAEYGETAGVGGHDPNIGRYPANVILDEAAAAMLDEQSGTLKSGDDNFKRETGADRAGNRSAAFGAESRPAGSEMVSYGDTGGASRFFYCAKASRSERNAGLDGMEKRPLHWSKGTQSPGTFQSEGTEKAARNDHPTVKPIALMRYLCRLITPPAGLILDPFAGSGTTCIAAVLEGFNYIGIDLNAHYCEIAEKRIAHWRKTTAQQGLFSKEEK